MLKKNNKGQKILAEAKKIIPGGNQLLSKRSENFLPNFWPNYYKSASGCVVKDLENKKYYGRKSNSDKIRHRRRQ